MSIFSDSKLIQLELDMWSLTERVGKGMEIKPKFIISEGGTAYNLSDVTTIGFQWTWDKSIEGKKIWIVLAEIRNSTGARVSLKTFQTEEEAKKFIVDIVS